MRRIEKKSWPTKRTLNLVIRETPWYSPSRMAPILLAIVAATVLFSKFAVSDRLAQVQMAQVENQRLQQSIAQLQQSYADYDQVAAQYHRYSYAAFTQAELAQADRMAVLELLETTVMPTAQVRNLAVNSNSLSLTLAGITLEQASSLVASLESSGIVDTVAVYTAGYDQNRLEGDAVRLLTMAITLAQAQEGGGD